MMVSHVADIIRVHHSSFVALTQETNLTTSSPAHHQCKAGEVDPKRGRKRSWHKEGFDVRGVSLWLSLHAAPVGGWSGPTLGKVAETPQISVSVSFC